MDGKEVKGGHRRRIPGMAAIVAGIFATAAAVQAVAQETLDYELSRALTNLRNAMAYLEFDHYRMSHGTSLYNALKSGTALEFCTFQAGLMRMQLPNLQLSLVLKAAGKANAGAGAARRLAAGAEVGTGVAITPYAEQDTVLWVCWDLTPFILYMRDVDSHGDPATWDAYKGGPIGQMQLAHDVLPVQRSARRGLVDELNPEVVTFLRTAGRVLFGTGTNRDTRLADTPLYQHLAVPGEVIFAPVQSQLVDRVQNMNAALTLAKQNTGLLSTDIDAVFDRAVALVHQGLPLAPDVAAYFAQVRQLAPGDLNPCSLAQGQGWPSAVPQIVSSVLQTACAAVSSVPHVATSVMIEGHAAFQEIMELPDRMDSILQVADTLRARADLLASRLSVAVDSADTVRDHIQNIRGFARGRIPFFL